MNNNQQNQPQPLAGMALGDIYYVLFRHKWKIMLFSLAGLLAAGAFYRFNPPPYQSQAELLIQYVPQAGALSLVGSDQKVIVPDARGEDIINSEIQILTSMDLAELAASNLGPASILGKAGSVDEAAGLIQGNLKAEPADTGSSVILAMFKHHDPRIVQSVLQEIINDYFQKHREIHSAGGQFDDALSREDSTLKAQLNDTEQQLASLKNRANIISLDDSRKGLADQISTIQSSILGAQAELAGYEAAFEQSGGTPSNTQAMSTNAAPTVVPPAQIDAYKSVCARLDALRKKQQDYLVQGFTSSNSLVQEVDGQIESLQKSKGDLQNTYPQIAGLAITLPGLGGSSATGGMDLQSQAAQVAALQAKLKAWDVQLGQLQMQATNLNNLAPAIVQLEQTKAIQEANYHNLATGIEKSHIDQALDTGKSPNIKWVQMPSPPFQDWKKNHKIVAMLAFGGVCAGLAWAFLMELVLDRSVRRPVEIEAHLKLPLLLSVPDVSRNGHSRPVQTEARRLLRPPGATEDEGPAGGDDALPLKNGALPAALLKNIPSLRPFYEALRDRLIVDFEVRGVTHKPKLVAVTSSGPGAGVSTVAAGLAVTLSETGDGNVLLVDMNQEQGSAQQFCHGGPVCGLDIALADETKEGALVRENLYVVSGESNSDRLPRVLPRRFAALVPILKASDYDYIIFDMPPVSQISITPRLAPFMDMVLMVVEAETTDRDVARQAADLLIESKAHVGVIFNKTRTYVPARIQQQA